MSVNLVTSMYGGGLIRRIKIPQQELEPKMQGGLIREGGRNCGILRYMSMYGCNSCELALILSQIPLKRARAEFHIDT